VDASVPFNSVALERKIHFLNAPTLGRFSEFRLGTPVPAAVHGNLRTIYHLFLLNFWFLPASACRRLSVISPNPDKPELKIEDLWMSLQASPSATTRQVAPSLL
jgi:hypothetical protein